MNIQSSFSDAIAKKKSESLLNSRRGRTLPHRGRRTASPGNRPYTEASRRCRRNREQTGSLPAIDP